MATREFIRTEIGILKGRDCIFLDRVSMPNRATLELYGGINTRIVEEFVPLADMPASKELPYILRFHGVLAVRILELEIHGSLDIANDGSMESSFDEIVGSEWIASMRGHVTADDRHFQVLTYDDVFEVVCREFDLTFQPIAT